MHFSATLSSSLASYCLRTTDKAAGFQNLFFPLLLTPQVGKGIDNNTKDEVEDDNDDHEEKQKVINNSGCEEWFLIGPVMGHIWKKKPHN